MAQTFHFSVSQYFHFADTFNTWKLKISMGVHIWLKDLFTFGELIPTKVLAFSLAKGWLFDLVGPEAEGMYCYQLLLVETWIFIQVGNSLLRFSFSNSLLFNIKSCNIISPPHN